MSDASKTDDSNEASATKTKKSAKKSGKRERQPRQERRFAAQGGIDAGIVRLLFAVGAGLLGAGTFGQFVRPTLSPPTADAAPLTALPYAYVLLAAGALVTGIALWVGSSGESAMRVGDGGVALEKGEIVRVAWNAIKELGWNLGERSVHLVGTDETGAAVDWHFREKTYGDGVAWILREARARIPRQVDVDIQTADEVDSVSADAGEVLRLEPLQVVGKRCASCDAVVAYEPDGRICPQCERVYHKTHVPDSCACGAPIGHLRPHKDTASRRSALPEAT